MLVAAAQETGLLAQLETALACCSSEQSGRIGRLCPASRQMLVLTLLFLGVVGLRRPWDLRGYTGDALALLTGRRRAYGYWHVERLLTQLAHAGAAEALTSVLLHWTTQLWEPAEHQRDVHPSRWYVDGHRKPVYSQQLIPRGLIGRTGKILGCRALTLLHDEWGHPRLVTTDRGDLHLTAGLTHILARYDQITEKKSQARIIVDREAMAAPLLKALSDEGHIMVTILRSNQYDGLSSFTDVGSFVPLEYEADGALRREVAPACFALALPEQEGAVLAVRVALIREVAHGAAGCGPCDLGLTTACGNWQDEQWQARPSVTSEPEPRLIPIVTTASSIDAVELAQTYIHRWPAQENVIKDYLRPLGIDTNHGFAKTPVVNSEVAKRREIFQKHLETFKKWMIAARTKYFQKIQSKGNVLEQIKKDAHQYHLLDTYQHALDKESGDYDAHHNKIQKKKDDLVIQQEKKKQRVERLSQQISQEQEKCERYAHKQCDLLRSLEDLQMNERTMYELDNHKDHVMTIFKVAMANLAMWTRDQYFPDTYSTATWERLAPFFRLPGMVISSQQNVTVSLRPFNDRQINNDLVSLCHRVNASSLHLPDGRSLLFTVQEVARPILDWQKQRVA